MAEARRHGVARPTISLVAKLLAVGGAMVTVMAPLFVWLELPGTPPGQLVPVEIVGIDLVQGKASLLAGLGLIYASTLLLFDDSARRMIPFRVICVICMAVLTASVIMLSDPIGSYLTAIDSKMGPGIVRLIQGAKEVEARSTGSHLLLLAGLLSGLSIMFGPGRGHSATKWSFEFQDEPNPGTGATLLVGLATLIVAAGLMLTWDITLRLVVFGDVGLPTPTALHGISFPWGRVLLVVTALGGFVSTVWTRWRTFPTVGILIVSVGILSLSSGLLATQTIESERDAALDWEWRISYGGTPTGGLSIGGFSAERSGYLTNT